MRIRWRNFELPTQVILDKSTATDSYGRFTAEPFERGFGATVGNGLRRVLLSSIEGTAVTSVRIDGVQHEFSTIQGVFEDVTDIILNLKKLRVKMEGDGPALLELDVNRKGTVTAADIKCDQNTQVVNSDLHICTLTDAVPFHAEIKVAKGRGYVTAEENIEEEAELGTIPVDSVFSPVYRVKFSIENTRVGKFTNYDRLILEIWTDGTVTPEQALVEASKIFRKHLNPFVQYQEAATELTLDSTSAAAAETEEEGLGPVLTEEEAKLAELLDKPLEALDLSVRARNCLDTENIRTVRDLVTKSEAEILKVKNFGKTSLREVKQKLAVWNLSLGMELPEALKKPLRDQIECES